MKIQLVIASLSWTGVSAFAPLVSSPRTSPSSHSSSCLWSTTSPTKSQDTPTTLPDFENAEAYMEYMKTVSALPLGFATGTAKGTFVSEEAPALGDLPIRGTLIYLPQGPTKHWAAVFTKNKFPGAPILVGRERLAQGGPLQALVINNKVSNVCSGGDGVADAEQVCRSTAEALKLAGGAAAVLPSSTGVIGWRLPAKALADKVVPEAAKLLQDPSNDSTALEAAQAICTTDRYPKVRSQTLSNGARVVGIAKGAGMIEPNMATMLGYVMTDACIERDTLQSMLSTTVDASFNSISVDGAESTSDTVVLVASHQVPTPAGSEDALQEEFQQALSNVCTGLAADIVRNGEGTGHVIRVVVQNYPGSDLRARQLGRHVVNSPLFKCAVSGNDPNIGRLAGAIGSFLGRLEDDEEPIVKDMTFTLGGRVVFSKGKFVLEGDAVEKEISGHFKEAQYDDHSDYPPHQKFVEIGIDFGDAQGGSGHAVVLGSDLTAEYVSINADYRS